MSLLIRIDTGSKTPVFRQIIDDIIARIAAGDLKPGDRLPATRILAGWLGVNRSTVCRAYQELWAMGYIDSRPGAYSTVRRRAPVAGFPDPPQSGVIDWAARAAAPAGALLAAHQTDAKRLGRAGAPGVVNFIPLSPDPRLLPVADYRRCMQHVLCRQGACLLHYGDPLGHGPLRACIASRLRRHGIAVDADRIIITTGAQGAIALVVRLLAGPGQVLACEAPTYPRALDLFRLAGVDLRAVPMNREGMDLDALSRLLAAEPLAMIYSVPNFHNPTGITTGQGHRERLLQLCERHAVPLVEDGFEEELKYFGKAVLPIKSMDRKGVVLYLGTFSKVLFPGLRIGWIAAEAACIRRLAAIQRAVILSGNLLDQAALARFCQQGHYDLHVKRMHRVYRRRMRVALGALATHVDSRRAGWTEPAGGYTIWLRLAGDAAGEAALADALLDRGVAVLPGASHFHGSPAGIHLRLSIAHLDEAAIETGIRRLGCALRDLAPAAILNPGPRSPGPGP